MTVTPEPINDLLANPGMGWQTFHRFADEDPALEGLPSGVAYFRYYWDEIEPEEGKIAFEKLDAALARARQAGQTLAFRIMCAGTGDREMYSPAWLRGNGCPGFEYRYGGKGRKYWVPDMDHEKFLAPHRRLIRELGKRYDGHPDLDHVDVGSVGLWAEWHMSGTGVEMPGDATQRRLIDAWDAAFPATPKLILIGCDEGMDQAVQRGWGWRADCLGDMGGFSKTWNHMDHMYRQQLKETKAEDAWKKGPVAFETCWDMRKWVEEGWDVKYIFDYALALHASYVNNKSAPVPKGQRPEVERLLRRLGYRLVLKKIEYSDPVRPGGKVKIAMLWENAGAAPPYRNDLVALRLSNPDASLILHTGASIRGWQPGELLVEESVTVPASLAPGAYTLSLALLDPRNGEPRVKLAIAGLGGDGWYPLGKIRAE